MSAALKLVHPRTFQRLLTAADLAVLPDELPSGPVRYELNNGRLVIMPPPGGEHGSHQLRIGTEFLIQGERKGHGKAMSGDVGIVLWENPDRVVGADVAFICKESLPVRFSKQGYLATIPDAVVEVKSRNDSWPELIIKVRDYLKAGVRVVLVADSKSQSVTAYRRGRKPKVYRMKDTLTLEDIIPGFRMAVVDVFV